jgi:hypothetical protein
MTMNPKLKSYLLHYLEGSLASAFNGGVAAATAFLGSAGASAAGANVAAMTGHQLVATFVGAAFLSALMYFKANPIPVVPPGTPAEDDVVQVPPTK